VITGRLAGRLPATTLHRAFARVVVTVAAGVATSALFFPAGLNSA
jgi:hypothetical protein